jgi:hypothetical protein
MKLGESVLVKERSYKVFRLYRTTSGMVYGQAVAFSDKPTFHMVLAARSLFRYQMYLLKERGIYKDGPIRLEISLPTDIYHYWHLICKVDTSEYSKWVRWSKDYFKRKAWNGSR